MMFLVGLLWFCKLSFAQDWCSNGILFEDDVCCDGACGLCGGAQCSSAPGGRQMCCSGSIRGRNVLCVDEFDTACIVPAQVETTQPPEPTEAETTETAPTEAVVTEAAPTEAATTEAAPTEAATTEAAPTEAATTEAAPTEAEPTEADPETTASGVRSMTFRLEFLPSDEAAFLTECSRYVQGVTCTSINTEDVSVTVVGDDSALFFFQITAEAATIAGIPLYSELDPTVERTYAFGTPNTADECPSGYQIARSEAQCAEAAAEFGSNYGGIGSWPVPRYCVSDVEAGGTIYYNTRLDGVPVSHRRPVCVQFGDIESTESPDSCLGITCENGEVCVEGLCECPSGSVCEDDSTNEPTSSTTGAPVVSPSTLPTPAPYRVYVKFISSYGCAIDNPRISAMEWNFYASLNATTEIESEFFDFTGNNDSPPGETPDMLSDDDDSTKWLSFLDCPNTATEGECVCTNNIELQFTLDYMPKYYSFVSGDHGQLRNPAKWNITLCCAEGGSEGNPHGCGEPMHVNVFESPYDEIYGPNLGVVEETGKFPLGSCLSGPSMAPTRFVSHQPSKTPTRSPHTSFPSASPFTPSDAPSHAPVYQDYFEWNCTNAEEPTSCMEYSRGLTQECEVAPSPFNETGSDYCCTVSDGSHYCCDYYDPNDPLNMWVGEDVARCTHTDSLCIQTCFKSLVDGTQRTCHKMCPDAPSHSPSTSPTALCEDQDEVYSLNGTTYWDQMSNRTMTCDQVIEILFTNNQLNCTVHFARQCPVACDMCTQIPSLSPTANPSRPPQEPSVSPSYTPSVPPHPKCADDFPVILEGVVLSANCTELTKQLLEGVACSDALARVCEASCPNACTEYPSKAPHVSPTTSPTTVPSKDPSQSDPTSTPSRTPSRVPTGTPSVNPTKAPNLDCVDVDVVEFFGGRNLAVGIPCEVAVQVVFDNEDICQGDLLRQCPDSCGTCTEEPTRLPSKYPSISCYDRYPVYDAESNELPNLSCEEIVFVLQQQFGDESPCTDHYSSQCPYSCNLCTPAPSVTPFSSFPSVTPSLSTPTMAPSMNTTFVPSISQQPSGAPSHEGPYQCGENMAQCDVGFTTLFAALILCQNQAYDDCPAVVTDCPDVVCEVCDECEACECPDTTCAICPECPPYTNGGSECECEVAGVETSVPTYDANQRCVTADGWWVGQVIEGLEGYDRETMLLCQSSGEYKVIKDGRVYPTCVAYGTPESNCTNSDLICPEHPQDPGTFGYSGNHRSQLATAFLRNDFKHQDCPTIQDQCQPLEDVRASYWKDLFEQKTGHDVSEAHNLCVNNATSDLRYVDTNAYYNTCVGFSRDEAAVCPTPRSFLCAGNMDGYKTFGWPGQIMSAVGRAVEIETKRHPQCPF